MSSPPVLALYVCHPYIKSLLSTPHTDKHAKISEIMVNTTGSTMLSDIVKLPILACVSIISRNEEIIVAFEDFIAKPTKSAIKLMVTVTKDFASS